MKLSFDPRYNIAYIRFHEKRAQVETVKISEDFNVDMAPDGSIYGVELLNASEQLQREDDGKLIVINEATGAKTEVVISDRQ
jgi:uncharacterized protein YuzE